MCRIALRILIGFGLIAWPGAPARAHDGMQLGGDASTSGVQASAQSFTPCQNGFAGIYPCRNIDLLSYLPISAIGGGTSLNDIWGWTDSLSGREYAVVGRDTGTSFVDVTDPQNPVYLGNLPPASTASAWRGVKTYNDFAFVISEAAFHGMQIFDLRRLRGLTAPVTFSADVQYNGFSNCHNIVLNEETGYAYAVGSNTCSGGPHMIDVHDPLHPVFAGCFALDGYTHDAQCVVYHGPDAAYVGHEICFNSNEDTLTVVDTTQKSAPRQLSRTGYVGSAYTHQGWLTADQAYFLLDDEFDERYQLHNTRTFVWNLADLAAPFVVGTWDNTTLAIDHNQYIRSFANGEFTFQSNYRSGLRILRIDDPAAARLHEVGYFDVYPDDDNPAFNGTWSNYPFFASGNVIVSGIEQGLFVLRPNLGGSTPSPTAPPTPTPTPRPSTTNTSTRSPTATITNTAPPTASFTPGPPGFSGQIICRGNGATVSDVGVALIGPTPGNTMTGINGDYSFANLTADGWEIMPAKSGGENGAITAIDAALVLQAVVGLRGPDAGERLAGDVNGNGGLSAIDAALILQHVVGLLSRFPAATRCNSDWVFVPSPISMDGQTMRSPALSDAGCQPGSITIDPLTQFAYGQDFTAVLFGDVLPTWTPPGGTCASCGTHRPVPPLRTGPVRRSSNGRIAVPLYLDAAVAGVEAELRFDPRRLHFHGLRRLRAGPRWLLASHSPAAGQVNLAMAAAQVIDTRGEPILLALFDAPAGASGRRPVRVEAITP